MKRLPQAFKLSFHPAIFILLLGVFLPQKSYGQLDTVQLAKDQVLVLQDSIFMPDGDTLLYIPSTTKYRIKKNEYARTQQFYDSIQTKAYKSRVTKELYKALITHRKPEEVMTNEDPVKSEDFFMAYRDKIVRSIRIVRVDLFEGSVFDTTLVAQSSLTKAANSIHSPTKDRVILKQLLFKEGDAVDPYLVADSERVLRTLGFIEDTRILLSPTSDDLDAVDAVIIVKDRFPWAIGFSGSSFNKFRLRLINRNSFGSGNETRLEYLKNSGETPPRGYDFSYTVRNIDRSFIDATAFIADSYLFSGRGLTVGKPFISPEINYNGEFRYENLTRTVDLGFADSVYVENIELQNETFDTWISRSFQFEDRKNISVAVRYLNDHNIGRPTVRADSNEQFYNREVFLTGLYYTKINFLKTKNILSFNITEDVPVGFINTLIFGTDWNEFETRNYVGLQSGFATYTPAGYFLLNVELGSFFNDEVSSNDALRVSGGYFTPMIPIGRSFSRTFFKYSFFTSNDLSIPISQSLSTDKRIRNISGQQLNGEDVATGTIESVLFIPWYFYGFRFAPYIFSDFGFVNETRAPEPFRNFYYNIGTGTRLRNEGLVFDTFEVRLAYFPQPPPGGSSFAFEFSFSRPILFRNFAVGKPSIVAFD